MSNANDKQVGGAHYKGTVIEHWDFAVRTLRFRYFESAITKYVARHKLKNGLQDVQKAEHYLEKLIEEFQAGRVPPMYMAFTDHSFMPSMFCDAYGLTGHARSACILVSTWRSIGDLEDALAHIRTLLSSMAATTGPGLAQDGATEPSSGSDGGAGAGPGYVDQG